MKKAITEEITTIPAGTVLGLNQKQASSRAHVLEKGKGDVAELLSTRTSEIPEEFRVSDEAPDGYRAVKTRAKTTFKRGEVLFVEGALPKHVSKGLVVLDEESGDQSDDDAPEKDNEDGKSYADMTVAEMKAELTERGVDFTGVRKKDDLLALLEESDSDEDGKSYADMTDEEIQAELTERAIDFDPETDRDELIGLLEQADDLDLDLDD